MWPAVLTALVASQRELSLASTELLLAVLRSTGPLEEKQSEAAQACLGAVQRLMQSIMRDDLEPAVAQRLQEALVAAAAILPKAQVEEDADAEEGGSESDSESGEEGGRSQRASPLAWWFSRVSFALRAQIPSWSRIGAPKVSPISFICSIRRRSDSAIHRTQDLLARRISTLLHVLASVAETLDESTLRQYLFHIINPVCRYSDPAIFDTRSEESASGESSDRCQYLDVLTDPHVLMRTVTEAATVLQDKLQAKVGVTSYAEAYNRVRQGIQERRQARKTKELMAGVADAEGALERRAAKNASKRESRKRKAQHHKAGKVRTKQLKHH